MEGDKQWLVIYTKPRWEKKVAKVLGEKGLTCLLSTEQGRFASGAIGKNWWQNLYLKGTYL